MANIIQLKRGTGSSVPSSLAEGELAINLDSGKLFYGSGSSVSSDFTVNKLTAETYVVSSSVTHMTTSFSSGSTAFGDSAGDTHTFTGAITASGNISASGDIFADDITATDLVSAGRFGSTGITSFGNSSDDTHTFTGDITASGNISSSGDIIGQNFTAHDIISTSFTGSVDNPAIRLGPLSGNASGNKVGIMLEDAAAPHGLFIPWFVSNGAKVFGFGGYMDMQMPIYMGNNKIVFDGDVTNTFIHADSATPENLEIHADGNLELRAQDDLQVYSDIDITGEITASGHISSSGTITANAFVGNITGDLTGEAATVATIAGLAPNTATTQATQGAITSLGTLTGLNVNSHITASGNISASGVIQGASLTTNQIKIESNGIVSTADTEVFMTLGASGFSFEANSGDLFSFNSENDNIDLKYASQNDDNVFYIDASADNVGIGDATPTAKLDVAGNINTTSHITASGNISSSGTITALALDINGVAANTIDISSGDGNVAINASSTDADCMIRVQDNSTAGTNAMGIVATSDDFIIRNDEGNLKVKMANNATTTLDLNQSGDLFLTGKITASGNISASGKIYADEYYSEGVLGLRYIQGATHIGDGNNIKLSGIVTASGNISSSGTITAENITVAAGATFGGGYGDTGATISTAGVGQFNGALTTDAGLTCTGTVLANGNGATTGARILLREGTDNGINAIGFQSPAAVTTTTTFVLPDGDGSNGQAMITNGSGTLSLYSTQEPKLDMQTMEPTLILPLTIILFLTLMVPNKYS